MMKSVLAFFMVLGMSQVASAAAAVSYSCVGKDKLSGSAVVYDLTFSDSAREVGYTNQAVTVKKVGYEEFESPLVYQMWGAKAKNISKKNAEGETYMNSAFFKMDPQAEGQIGDYLVSFKSDCQDVKLDVEGICFFE